MLESYSTTAVLGFLLAVAAVGSSTLTAALTSQAMGTRSQEYNTTDSVQLSCSASNFYLEVSNDGAYLYQRQTTDISIERQLTKTGLGGGALDPTGNMVALFYTTETQNTSVQIYKQVRKGFTIDRSLTMEKAVTAVSFLGSSLVVGLVNGSIAIVQLDTTSKDFPREQFHSSAVVSISTNSTHFVSVSNQNIAWGRIDSGGKPTKLLTLNTSNAISVALGGNRTFIGYSDGKVQCVSNDFNYTTAVLSGFSNQRLSASSGGSWFIATSSEGTMRLWGRNDLILDFSKSDVNNIAAACITPTNEVFSAGYPPVAYLYALTYDCSAVTDSNQTNRQADSCVCKTGFYWKEGLCYRNCSLKALENGINTDRQTCGCKPPASISNGDCQIDCSSDTYSSGGLNAEECPCLTGAYWNATLMKCQINCSNISNSTNRTVSGTVDTCVCTAGFKWVNQACYRDCGLTPHGVSIIGYVDCSCESSYTWNGSACVKSCSEDDFSNGTGSGQKCNCKENYYWNSTFGACTLNCSTVQYALNENPSTSECTCRDGFRGKQSPKFECIPECTSMTGSTGITTGKQCICNDTYFWSDVGCILNCSKVPNSIGINDPANPQYCLCAAGYIQSENLCLLDCSANAFSSDDYTINQACTCNSNAVQFGNICAENCQQVTNSDKSSNYNSVGECSCRTGYVYSSGACIIDCSAIPRSDGVNYNDTACNCEVNFDWNGDFCFPDCHKTEYGAGPVKNVYDMCECKSGYYWDKTIRQCLPNPHNSKVSLGLGLGLGLGLPIVLGLLAFGAYFLWSRSLLQPGFQPAVTNGSVSGVQINQVNQMDSRRMIIGEANRVSTSSMLNIGCQVCGVSHPSTRTSCGHQFHLQCLMTKMRVNNNVCPVCNASGFQLQSIPVQ